MVLIVNGSIPVLVPFDIGVVYILGIEYGKRVNCFSPLRYWGSLYPLPRYVCQANKVLVPFDIGVVYILYPLSYQLFFQF